LRQGEIENSADWKSYIQAEARTNDDSIIKRVFNRNCIPQFVLNSVELKEFDHDYQGLDREGLTTPKGPINAAMDVAGISLHQCTASHAFALRRIFTSGSIRMSIWINQLRAILECVFYLAFASAQLVYVPSSSSTMDVTIVLGLFAFTWALSIVLRYYFFRGASSKPQKNKKN
jgi:hypothetical protein